MGGRRQSGRTGVARPAGPVDVPSLVRALPDVVAAERLAAALLSEDPERLRHVHTVATVTLVVAEVVPPARLDVLLCAAVLHDVGYAPLLRSTGFHPLDGACWLLAHGAPVAVAGLVAHHSEALLQPAAGRFLDVYDTLRAPDRLAADILTYADQTTTPDGRRTGVVPRVAERWRRTGAAAGPGRAQALRRVERLVGAVTRVDAALVAAGGRDPSLEAVDALLVAARPAPDDAGPHVTAAVHAARLLAATGLDAGWDDEARTAVRLLGDAAPAAPALVPGQPAGVSSIRTESSGIVV